MMCSSLSWDCIGTIIHIKNIKRAVYYYSLKYCMFMTWSSLLVVDSKDNSFYCCGLFLIVQSAIYVAALDNNSNLIRCVSLNNSMACSFSLLSAEVSNISNARFAIVSRNFLHTILNEEGSGLPLSSSSTIIQSLFKSTIIAK